jgi:hypothetical protein
MQSDAGLSLSCECLTMARGIDHQSFAILPRTIQGAESVTLAGELRDDWADSAELEAISGHAASWGNECMALCDILLYGC